jgi:hypothetical protein
MAKNLLRFVSHLCVVLGFLSIIGAVFMWVTSRGDGGADAIAHAERWGIFVGLWVPSFFALSTRLDRYADRLG